MFLIARLCRSNILLFLFFWTLVFLLYLPAIHAGYVSDYTGWLKDLQESSFADHINRTHFKVKSLYQFTQLVTWAFFQVFGTCAWLWHGLHVTLHALNCVLLFRTGNTIFRLDQVQRSEAITFCGCVLFCLIPSVSEVIVWESAFHYLLGLLLLLSVLRLTQLYLQRPRNTLVIAIGIIYFLATYAIELFYLTPVFTAALLWYSYRHYPDASRRAGSRILLPLLLLLGLHFVQVKLVYGHWLPHINSVVLTDADAHWLWSKPLKYVFHILFLGRFYSQQTRDGIYALCENDALILGFYGLVLLLAGLIWYRRKGNGGRAALLLYGCCAMAMGLMLPLWFPQLFWVVYDRYSYCFTAFFFILFSYALFRLLGQRLAVAVILLSGLVNTFATYKVNVKWGASHRMTDALMKGLPAQSDKPVLLLNMPYCWNGIYMINGGSGGEAREMHNALYQPPVTYKLTDVCLYNILSDKDGAHVQVLNDSTLRVTLNQWGTWWWYDDQGAGSYETADYKLNMIDNGHFYELTLKHDPANYLLLFQNGAQWKPVDWSRKDVEQY